MQEQEISDLIDGLKNEAAYLKLRILNLDDQLSIAREKLILQSKANLSNGEIPNPKDIKFLELCTKELFNVAVFHCGCNHEFFSKMIYEPTNVPMNQNQFEEFIDKIAQVLMKTSYKEEVKNAKDNYNLDRKKTNK